MKLRRSTVFGLVVTVLLAASCAALVHYTPRPFDAQFRAAAESAQSLRAVASQWVVEISGVRADPSSHFDSVSAFVPRMLDLRARFSRAFDVLPVSERLASDARAYLASLDALAVRVERFKTAYSALRNSARYLPLSADVLVEQARAAQADSLAREIVSLASGVAAYVESPSAPDAQSLLARVQLVSAQALEHTDPLTSGLLGFVAHARVVLIERPRLQTHFDAIKSNEVASHAAPLTAGLEAAHLAHRDRVTLYQRLSFALAAAIVLLWLAIGVYRWRVPVPRPSPAPAPAPPADPPAPVAVAPVSSAPAPAPPLPAVLAPAPSPLVDAMIRSGVLPGLLGRAVAAHARRLLSDLDALDPAQRAPTWTRMSSDARALAFFAERLTVLGRQFAPKTLDSVDFNGLLATHLDACPFPSVRRFETLPPLHVALPELDLLLSLAVDWASHCLRGLAPHDAELIVGTRPLDGGGAALALIHNGEWLSADRQQVVFVPFAISRSMPAGLSLPAVRYLARRMGGSVGLELLDDGRSRLAIQLRPPQGGAS